MKYESRIRALTCQWIRLLRDTNSDAIHASISEGGLGIPSILALSKKLEDTRLHNIESIGDKDDGEITICLKINAAYIPY